MSSQKITRISSLSGHYLLKNGFKVDENGEKLIPGNYYHVILHGSVTIEKIEKYKEL